MWTLGGVMQTLRIPKLIIASLLATIVVALFAACGSDPTPTTAPATNTPTPTVGAGTPTSTPGSATPTAAPTATPDTSFDAEAFFRGRQIKINVGFAPGGGYDTFSRLFAKYMPKHLPGEPSIIVRNVPGSGGLRGLQVTEMDDPDGLTISILHPRFIKREMIGEDVEGFDMRTIQYIGSASATNNTNALYAHRDQFTTWDELVATGRTYTNGETAPGASTGAGVAFMAALGGPVRIVYGYGGSAEILAAFDRREVDLTTNGGPDQVPNLFPEWIENKEIVPLVWWSTPPEEDPEFLAFLEALDAPVPPHIFDVLNLTDEQKEVFALSEDLDNVFSRTFVMHSETPPEIVAVWREAFRKLADDPEFKQAAAVANYEVGYTSPETMQEAIEAGALLEDEALRELFVAVVGEE
jgi:tripartite-type tricarboxylate transporter receptor subunit TctC